MGIFVLCAPFLSHFALIVTKIETHLQMIDICKLMQDILRFSFLLFCLYQARMLPLFGPTAQKWPKIKYSLRKFVDVVQKMSNSLFINLIIWRPKNGTLWKIGPYFAYNSYSFDYTISRVCNHIWVTTWSQEANEPILEATNRGLQHMKFLIFHFFLVFFHFLTFSRFLL